MRRVLHETGWAILILLLLGIHLGILNSIPGVGMAVHPLFLLSIFCALFGQEQRAVVVAFIGGIMLDWYSALPFGIYVTVNAAGICAFIFFQRTIFKQRAVHFYLLNTIIASVVFLLFGYATILLGEKLHWVQSALIDVHLLWKGAALFLICQSVVIFCGTMLFASIQKHFLSDRLYVEKSI